MTDARTAAGDHAMQHLDVLRFIASCAIVLHHSWEFFFPKPMRAWWSTQTHSVSIFVDVFFVISGFVIATVYHSRVRTLPEYFAYLHRRVSRLLPLHWATLMLSILIYLAIEEVGLRMQHAVHFNASCVFSTMAFAHTLFGCAPGEVYNAVNWSLSAEMVMYVAFPLLLAGAVLRPRFTAALAVVLFAAIVTIVGARNGADFEATAWEALVPAVRALPAFLFGICLHTNRALVSRFPRPRFWTWLLLVSLVVSMLLHAPAVISLALAYALVAAGVAADISGEADNVTRRLAPLGELTYSMYLLHPCIILVMVNGLGDKVLKLQPAPMAVMLFCAYAVIFFAAKTSHRRFESPARRFVDGLWMLCSRHDFRAASRGSAP